MITASVARLLHRDIALVRSRHCISRSGLDGIEIGGRGQAQQGFKEGKQISRYPDNEL
jgi:hypothetical protein